MWVEMPDIVILNPVKCPSELKKIINDRRWAGSVHYYKGSALVREEVY